MKIPFKRFRDKAEMVTVTNHQLFSGAWASKTTVNFRFMYANLHESINNQLSNLGTKSTETYMIASLDPRLKKYLNNNSKDQVSINGINYRLTNVTVDDSDLVPVYELTISLNTTANGNGPSTTPNTTNTPSKPKKRLPWQHSYDDDDGDDDY